MKMLHAEALLYICFVAFQLMANQGVLHGSEHLGLQFSMHSSCLPTADTLLFAGRYGCLHVGISSQFSF